ncbi:hypothetical protein QEH59_06940 [Coraliomargarita sp. SDUM461004]|uniref:Uncharacterized protein n=1 Tax=Thalassobacterium sedimentorum TaxID=3041258 RepID=A0ABU1AKP4_9BACT|nr:hypothetical protein [Coraliomargarita sp. SDUM461004]MDQ8194153.1 hypothetical protein [Coraliomargarita sp. SDUM461004]
MKAQIHPPKVPPQAGPEPAAVSGSGSGADDRRRLRFRAADCLHRAEHKHATALLEGFERKWNNAKGKKNFLFLGSPEAG